MTDIISKNINKLDGPLTNYLRSNNSKKKQSSRLMSGNVPKIKVVNGEENTVVNIKNPTKLDNIDIMSDSGSSVKSIPRQSTTKPAKEFIKPPKISRPSSSQSAFPQMDINEFQHFINSQKQRPVIEKEDVSEQDSEGDYEEDYEESVQDNYSEESFVEEKINSKDNEKKKRELLVKLIALENKGVELTKKFSLKSNFADIEFEYETQKKELETQAGVKFQQKALMAFVTGVEFLNNKFDPVGAKLDGWSESVMDSMNDYDNVFRRLYEKYASRAELPPELELLMTLVASGFMFHLTNTFFKSNTPMMTDLFKNNPDILNNIAAAMNTSGNSQKPSVPSQSIPSQSVPSQSVPSQSVPSQRTEEMSGPSLNLSSLINQDNKFNVSNMPIPLSSRPEKEIDRFSLASSSSASSALKSTISKSGKKTISI